MAAAFGARGQNPPQTEPWPMDRIHPGNSPVAGFPPTRQASVVERLQAGLPPIEGMSPGQVQEHRAYYNQVLSDITTVRGLGLGDRQSLASALSQQPEKTQQEVSIELALRSGQPTPLINAEGRSVMVQVQRLGEEREGNETFDCYSITMNGNVLKVRLASGQGANPNQSLARIADWWSQVPPGQQNAVQELTVHAGPNPDDAHWQKVYDDPSFVSGGSAGNGKMDIWNGPRNLVESLLNHESGHLIAERLRPCGQAERFPPGWEEAIRADGRKVSDYAGHNPSEDFAESWASYLAARQGGRDAIRQFREQFPNRSRILDQIYEMPPMPRLGGLGI